MIFRLIILSIIISLIPFSEILAQNNPKIANYFLNDQIYQDELEKLAKWDLVILDMELQKNNPEALGELRRLNPDIILLAYISSQEIYHDLKKRPSSSLRKELLTKIEDSWWLKDKFGNKITFWPGTYMFNLTEQVKANNQGEKFNDFLPRFVHEKIQSSKLWDGIFYDNIWDKISWINPNLEVSDEQWREAYLKLFKKTRELCGEDFLITGNGKIYEPYLPQLHGQMLEGFPSQWEGGWADSMEKYLKIPSLSRQPNLSIINVYNKDKESYQVFRFGLTSTMLGEAYFSFDYDVGSHGQTWWYDEYEIDLGEAHSNHYNLLDINSLDIKPGLWRRDFENGSIIVNSTDTKQRIIFEKEVFEKIKGSQDTKINNGQRINWLELDSYDGILLLNELDLVNQASFLNGQFINVLDKEGKQLRNGFFSYLNQFPALSEVLIVDLLSDGRNEYIYSHQGEIVITKNGQEINRFSAFHPSFKGDIALAVGDINGNGQSEIIAGAGYGGGPQLNIFNIQGELVSTFFAFDKNFRGGVQIALGDINGNGKKEIICTPGPGGGPQVRVFDYLGKELSNFFAYEKNFRSGLSITSANILNNTKDEIIVAPLSGENLELKYFDEKGEQLESFVIKGKLESLKLSASDINNDDKVEILYGINNY